MLVVFREAVLALKCGCEDDGEGGESEESEAGEEDEGSEEGEEGDGARKRARR